MRACVCSFVHLFASPWTAACRAPPSIGVPRQEYWSGLPVPSPEYLPDPGTEPESPTLASRFLPTEPPRKPQHSTAVAVHSRSCPTFSNPMDCSTPGFPVLHHLPEFAQTHVHLVGDAIQPSHPLPPSSPTFSLSYWHSVAGSFIKGFLLLYDTLHGHHVM